MKSIKLFAVVLIAVLMAACGSEKTKRSIPYTKEFYGLRGNVKYVVYSYYKDNYVNQAIRRDFSPEGMLTQEKVFLQGDSIVAYYSYDKKGMISSVSGSGVISYSPKVEKGMLVEETVEYKKGDNTDKQTKAYRYDDTSVTKILYCGNDSTFYRYDRMADGVYQMVKVKSAHGTGVNFVFDSNGQVASVDNTDADGNVTSADEVTAEYDEKGNITKYRQKHKRKTVSYYTVSYQYYADEELAGVKAASTVEAADDGGYSGFDEEFERPDGGLLVFFVVLALISLIVALIFVNKAYGLFENYWGEVQDDGMKKIWFYNSEPYFKTGAIFGITIASFIAAIIIMFLFGCIVWGLFWLIKLIFWAIIIIGWIMLVGGILALLGKKGAGCLPLILGALIVAYQEKLEEWGEMFVEWGEETLDTLNLFEWLVSIYHAYGITIALIIAAPFACFAALALVLIIISQILRFVEFVVMKIYRVNRPCPHCGSTDGFEYIVDGKPYTVDLEPGMYGIFHHTNRLTDTRVPTMLLNGKAQLTRRCTKCGEYTNQTGDNIIGTDVHIGVVGERSSGKSYMLYSALALLQERLDETFDQVDATRNNNIEDVMTRVRNLDGIQTQVKNLYKAIQMKLKMKLRPMPYHMFFYDVAGEMFNIDTQNNQSALDFYTNVKSVVYVIDPTNVDLTVAGVSASEQFTKWQTEKYNDSEKYNAEATMAKLMSILENNGRDTKDIALYVVCTKKDLGYFEAFGYSQSPSSDVVRTFIRNELGLYNLGNTMESAFRSVDYTAVSVTDDNKDALYDLFVKVFKQNGINVG